MILWNDKGRQRENKKETVRNKDIQTPLRESEREEIESGKPSSRVEILELKRRKEGREKNGKKGGRRLLLL